MDPTITQKLRLMCSYGGHIIPRPTNKTLCYAGGDTRIVAVDRTTSLSLSSLTTHLSQSLLSGRPFTLKYQLPNHDLDSLITVADDEDLANMVDELDRLSAPHRLRFFLFPTADPVPEEWFVDALRNVGKTRSLESNESEGKVGAPVGGSLPESIVLEKNSSFGSTGSSASASNSPAVRSGDVGSGGGVRVQDVKVLLPTLDSISSDSSLASPNFSPQAIVYQDASGFVDSKVVSATLVETESNASDRSPRSDLLSPVQVPGYILTKPMDQLQQASAPLQPPQPQYIHPINQSHYVTQYYTNPVPVASYPTMYQPYVQPQQSVQYQINKTYPVYMMPVGQTQNPYDMSMQCTLATAPSVAPDPQLPINPVMVASSMAYEGYKPAFPAPEYASKVYETPEVATQPINATSNCHLAHAPVNQPSPPAAAAPENTNYINEYEDPMHAQIYKTQPPGPTFPSQLQTATNNPSTMLPEAFAQLHVDNKH